MAVALALLPQSAQSAQSSDPLVLDATIPIADVPGRIDHLSIDLARGHLFVAELGNDSVDVIDLASRKVMHRITGLNEPQGVGYVTGADLVVVSCGGDGTVKFFSGADFLPRGTMSLGDDADNVHVDPRNGHVAVGFGNGGLAIIDPIKRVKLVDVHLADHPEGFRLSSTSSRIYMNVPDAHQIAVADSGTGKVIATWMQQPSANFPMALDETGHFVAVVFRASPTLALLDLGSGSVIAKSDTCGDADDVFVDSRRSRLYVSCGAGSLDVFQRDNAGIHRLGRVSTSWGARTSLFVPELDRLFVAERAGLLGSKASIQVYRPN